QGKNDFGKLDYGGPCPPSGTHRYYFKLYALDTMLDLQPGASKKQLEKAMNGHVIEEAKLMRKYSR
ncbi:MAG: YbhB/YbcL family Raf kinase inhibitor-like protein, partial [Candidatus Thermoplasmatota archaeon]|nr:YbhB/YbcL family Raf kinase inhibitor-like protein [Candidatus Thermoplasmatota archaeon]